MTSAVGWVKWNWAGGNDRYLWEWGDRVRPKSEPAAMSYGVFATPLGPPGLTALVAK